MSEIKRFIPGKREVSFDQWNNQDVVIKRFLDPNKSAKHLRRELLGLNAFMQSDIPSPKILVNDADQHILITERLPNAISLLEQWQASAIEDEQLNVIYTLVEMLAKLHNNGFVQHDVHLGNYLISNNIVYAIDGDSVSKAVSDNRKYYLANLALAFAQFPKQAEELCWKALSNYSRITNWKVNSKHLRYLAKQIQHCRNKQQKRFLAKVFRNCTRYKQERSFKTNLIFDRSLDQSAFKQALKNIDALLEKDLLKDGNSNTVGIISIDNKKYVVKRYNLKNFWHRLRRCLRNTRAHNSWHYAHLLEYHNINTPKPVALLEHRFGRLKGKSYYVCEYIEGTPATDYFQQQSENVTQTATTLSNTIKQLAQAKISHGDMKATNFIIKNQQVYVIDLDAMQAHKNQKKLQIALNKDQQRFIKNWQDNPDTSQMFMRILAE